VGPQGGSKGQYANKPGRGGTVRSGSIKKEGVTTEVDAAGKAGSLARVQGERRRWVGGGECQSSSLRLQRERPANRSHAKRRHKGEKTHRRDSNSCVLVKRIKNVDGADRQRIYAFPPRKTGGTGGPKGGGEKNPPFPT